MDERCRIDGGVAKFSLFQNLKLTKKRFVKSFIASHARKSSLICV